MWCVYASVTGNLLIMVSPTNLNFYWIFIVAESCSSGFYLQNVYSFRLIGCAKLKFKVMLLLCCFLYKSFEMLTKLSLLLLILKRTICNSMVNWMFVLNFFLSTIVSISVLAIIPKMSSAYSLRNVIFEEKFLLCPLEFYPVPFWKKIMTRTQIFVVK